MNTRSWFVLAAAPALLAAAALLGSRANAGDEADEGDAATLKSLATTKHSLVDGIHQAAKSPGVAISAKFEDEGKGLSLSVYVAGKGLGASADENVLEELSGSPTGAEWKPETEVFKDVEHVARSAEQVTLMRLTSLTLADVVRTVERETEGVVYSIAPTIVEGVAVFSVRMAIAGRPDDATVDLKTGRILAAPKAGWPIPRLRAPDYVGRELPGIVVGKGQWIGEAPVVPERATAPVVTLVASNSYLCEGTDEAWMWKRLVPWYEELEGKGLAIRFVLQGGTLAEAKEYVKQRKVGYPVLHDPTGENAKQWDVGLAPAAFLVGAEGRVLWQGYWQPGKAADACERALRAALDRRGAGPR